MAENNVAINQGAAFDHDRWLTLRAAYNQYKSASATLGAFTAASLIENSPPARDHTIEAAAAEERAAFETYVEARLALSESMAFPAQGWPASEENVSNEERADDWRRSRISRTVLLVAVAAWLLPAALSLENWMGQRRQARDLEAVRDEANILLEQTRNQVAEFAETAEVLKAAPQPVNNSAAAADVKKTVRRKQPPAFRSTRKRRKIARNHQRWVLLD